MADQVLNLSEAIANLLFEKWSKDFPPELKKDKIDFAGFSYYPDGRFQSGKDIVIEIDDLAGTPETRTQGLTMMLDLFKIDVWVRVADTSKEGRIRAENNRAKVKGQVMDIIHDNSTTIPGIEIARFSRFQKLDEPQNNILHNIVYVTGQWHHRKS